MGFVFIFGYRFGFGFGFGFGFALGFGFGFGFGLALGLGNRLTIDHVIARGEVDRDVVVLRAQLAHLRERGGGGRGAGEAGNYHVPLTGPDDQKLTKKIFLKPLKM